MDGRVLVRKKCKVRFTDRCHCELCSSEAIQDVQGTGLLRYARNDIWIKTSVGSPYEAKA